jgi:NAD(P)-dependent dehydrogenase (short-subunit alcohol dehydrogenase family)
MLKVEALTFGCDLSDKTQVITMGKDTIDKFGPIDISVNNAGIGIHTPKGCNKLNWLTQQIIAVGYGGSALG